MRRTIFAGLLALAQTAQAETPELFLPVDCVLGETCHIQNYVDADAGPDYGDFACEALSYDGHKGTDFATPTHLSAMQGVAVLAAAPGVVSGLRDGLPDAFLGDDAPFPEGQDCGNGVVIDHGQGWQTQYCHLAQNSVSVVQGQQVTAGTPLGRIGMSGRTAFPHLHLSLRHDGRVVDPFDPAPDAICGAPSDAQIWATPIPYGEGAILDTGFAAALPDYDTITWGKAHRPELTGDDTALVFWAFLYGARKGDVLHLTIEGENGRFFEQDITLDRTQARSMRAGGRKLHTANRLPGTYTGTAVLMRDGRELSRTSAKTVLIK